VGSVLPPLDKEHNVAEQLEKARKEPEPKDVLQAAADGDGFDVTEVVREIARRLLVSESSVGSRSANFDTSKRRG
jgi:hypothetical protein